MNWFLFFFSECFLYNDYLLLDIVCLPIFILHPFQGSLLHYRWAYFLVRTIFDCFSDIECRPVSIKILPDKILHLTLTNDQYSLLTFFIFNIYIETAHLIQEIYQNLPFPLRY